MLYLFITYIIFSIHSEVSQNILNYLVVYCIVITSNYIIIAPSPCNIRKIKQKQT